MKRRRRLWLHVGLPKTATTALQSWMRENTPHLTDAGITYPSRFGPANDKHTFLVGALRQDADLAPLQGVLDTAPTPDVLLSNEGLSNHLDDFHPSSLARFREVTASWSVHVLLVSRDPTAWTRSYHKQCVLNPNNGSSPLWGTSLTAEEIAKTPRVQRLLATQALSGDLVKAFGAQSLERFNYDDPEWFDSILTCLGLDASPARSLSTRNSSLPDWAIEVMRRVNAMEPASSKRSEWKAALQAYLQSDHTVLTGANFHTSELPAAQIRSLLRTVGTMESNLQGDTQRFLRTLDIKKAAPNNGTAWYV